MISLVQAEKIEKSFQTGPDAVSALQDVSIEIAAGEFTAIVGPSGSGKTTLLNLLGCLDAPDRGSIRFDGREMTKLGPAALARERLAHIGFIFQDYNLIPTLSAIENVEFALWLQNVPSSKRREESKKALERVGLAAFAGRRPNQLSRGQQQRVAVCRAIVHKPKIVYGDELTANLDHKTADELMDFLKQLNREDGVTFVYATHDPAIVERASRVVRLHDGKITDDRGR